MGELRENQQALRDQLRKLMEELRKKGFGQGQQGQGEMDQLGRAGDAMGDAEGQLGEGNADGAAPSSPASAANRIRATESLFAEAINAFCNKICHKQTSPVRSSAMARSKEQPGGNAVSQPLQ